MLDPTLFGLLSQVGSGDIVLPAMQRPFVWKEDRIYRLIDSLLRGFPIGAIMLWRTATVQRFRRFPMDVDTEIAEVFTYETSDEYNAHRYLVLDGQQRLTSLFAAFKGTYNHKRLYIDVLSGNPNGKDPGSEYYDCQFLAPGDATSLNMANGGPRRHFAPLGDLIKIDPVKAASAAHKSALDLKLTEAEAERMADIYIRCASILGKTKSLQVITVDEDPSSITPVEEILEIFVRVNSGGLVLQKSDLLMSLLDLTWNDIQPELQQLVRDINQHRPFNFTRDDVLKSLLLAEGAETRFDKLVSDRNNVQQLAKKLPAYIADMKRAWQLLGCILMDDCKIHSERFFRGGHNALLPFVLFLSRTPVISDAERKTIVIGIYLSLMSGVFSGAEARMGAFARNKVAGSKTFPLADLIALVKREYGISSLDDLLRRHLDLTLNIAHGGIMLDNNPEQLQRDHIFPKSKLEQAGYPFEVVNHYANFHFLRAIDNLNKLDKPPHEWFRNPGKDKLPYSEIELDERLLTWNDLNPGQFEAMIDRRGEKIREKAEKLFGSSEEGFNLLFADKAIRQESANAASPVSEKQRSGQHQLTPSQEMYRNRIIEILDCFRQLLPDRTPRIPASGSCYKQISTGTSGVHFEWYLHGKAGQRVIDVAIHFETTDKQRNQEYCALLKAHESELVAILKEPLLFVPEWGDNWAYVCMRRDCEPWGAEVARWSAEKMFALINSVEPLLSTAERSTAAGN